jgi:hypothetical protein
MGGMKSMTYVGNVEGAEVEEDLDVGLGFEFTEEFFVHAGNHVTRFVEEDCDALGDVRRRWSYGDLEQTIAYL